MGILQWQREMIRCLFPYSAERLKIEDGLIVKFPHVPTKLYKYRDFSNPFHRRSLEADQQWFSSPDHFNDPFDTVTNFNTDYFLMQKQSIEECLRDIQHIRQFEASQIEWRPQAITDQISSTDWHNAIIDPIFDYFTAEHIQNTRECLRQLNAKFNRELVHKFSSYLRTGFAVLSLSANPRSNLMWSHYAASHRGFCIEYDFGALPHEDVRKRMCFPVLYRRKRTDISRYFARPSGSFNNLVGQYLCLLKNEEWAYEQEWRIVYPIGPNNTNCLYPMPAPSGLIVGSLVGEDELAYARRFCQDRHIPLKIATQETSSYSVELVEL